MKPKTPTTFCYVFVEKWYLLRDLKYDCYCRVEKSRVLSLKYR